MDNFSVEFLVKTLVKYLHFIIISAVVFAIAAFSYCHFVAVPKYSAKGSVLLTNGAIITTDENTTSSQTIAGADITASLSLKDTVIDILKTSDIYKEMSDKLDGKYSYTQLASAASIVSRSTGSLFVDISFTAVTPEEAINLTNTYLTLVPDYIADFIPNSNSAVTTTAERASKTYPRTASTTILASLSGAVISFLIVYIFSIFNTTINSEDDIADHYDIPLIGSVPDFSTASNKGYYRNYKNSYYSSYAGGYYSSYRRHSSNKGGESNEK